MNTTEINYFITGWQADNDLSPTFTQKMDTTMYPIVSKEIAEYINQINDTKTTQTAVLNTLQNTN